MMPSERRALRLSYAAALALPLLAVGGVRMAWLSKGPASAGASQIKATNPKGILDKDKPASPVTRHAHAEIERVVSSTLANALGPCPLYAPEIRRSAAPPSPANIPGIPQASSIPDFRLTSIATGGRDLMAVVDGRVRRVGEEVREGWKVESIDKAAQTVTFAGPDGQSSVAKLRTDDKR